MSDDSVSINIKSLIKSLEPDELGKFEPLSGLMLINLPHDEYMAAFTRFAANASTVEDIALIGTINHETYHAMQAAASGYGFDRQRRLAAVFAKMEAPDPSADPEVKSLLDTLHAAAGDDPALKARAARAEAMLLAHRTVEMLDAQAAPGDNSLFGAIHPAFFRCQTDLVEHEAACNPDGLSIQGLLEGSAVAFAHCLMQPGGAREAIEAELATLPPLYQELYTLTAARAGERALELIMPAVALALCYSEPHNAYAEMLALLAAAPPGGALAYGRKIIANLPAHPAAGAILGTSIDVRRTHDSYRIYDQFIQYLEAGRDGVDAYAALADPASMNQVRSMPFAIVTADDFHASAQSMTYPELVMRMLTMSWVLRVAGRRRQELDLQNLQLQWAHDVLHHLVDNLPSS